MAHYHRFLLFKHKEDKTYNKTTKKKTKRREGTYLKLLLCSLTFGSRFAFSLLVIISTLLFQTLSLSIFFFSNKRKTKRTKKNKTIKKKQMQKKDGAFLQVPVRPSHFWLLLLPFCFKRFFETSFSSQAKEKKRNHREE